MGNLMALENIIGKMAILTKENTKKEGDKALVS